MNQSFIRKSVWLFVLCILCGACKRDTAKDNSYGVLTPPPSVPVAQNNPAVRTQPVKERDWRYANDAAVDGASATKIQAVVIAGDGGAVSTDAELAEQRRYQALRQFEQSADAALASVRPSLMRCYEATATRAGQQTQVQFQVHRTGYVTDVQVSGVSDPVQRCIESIVRNLRVKRVESTDLTDESLTVKRTFTR